MLFLQCLLLLLAASVPQLVASDDIYVDEQHGISNTSCCSSSSAMPCNTLNLALECVQNLPLTIPVSLFVNEGVYTLVNDSRLTVIVGRTGGFSITGKCSTTAACEVEINCEKGAGLSFIKSDEIILENVVFSGCGFPNNSTSKNLSNPEPEFLQVTSTLYFLLCRTVTISHVTVQETEGTGVVMYSTVGINTITNSNFTSNHMNVSDTITGGGGMYIEFAYCYPGNNSCFNGPTNIPEEYTRSSMYIISNCIFSHNLATVADSYQFTYILPQKWNHLAFGREGGLSLFFKGSAINNTVNIENCEFSSNKALWGGGLFIEMQDFSSQNNLSVKNTIFLDNECFNKEDSSSGTGGGGARIGYIFFDDTHVKQNFIVFENCTFSYNSAYFGGGVSFFAAREPTESSSTNSMVFRSTTWQNNVARAGSGADFSVWHTEPRGAVATVNFTNCCFQENTGLYTEEQSTVVGIGALYLDSIPVYFMGNNVFRNNQNSALAATTTGIYITTDATVNFIRNRGRYGGAVALFGAAFIQTYPSSRVEFVQNTAEIEGGAIYEVSIGEHDLINSRNCFIRYSDITVTPEKWNSSFFFSANTANGRNESIFASSLLICQWGGASGNSSGDLSKVFCWSKENWDYDGGNCKTEVRTSPAIFNSSTNYSIEVLPGKRDKTHLTMWDDRGSDVTSSSVFLARSISKDIHIDSNSLYISSNRIKVHARNANNKEGVNGTVLLETIDPRVVQVRLNVSILPCPPGMILEGDNNTASCQCGHGFGGIVECDATHFITKIQRGNWIGLFNGRIVASRTPYFDPRSNDLFIPLPKKSAELDEQLCGPIKRTGTMCGKCVDGYGPSLHTLQCIRCNADYMWALYLVSQFLPLTLLFIVVLLLDIRVTSAPANAFIFFAQVLPTVFTLDGGGAITLGHTSNHLVDVYSYLYNIWNLQFFREKICLSPNLNSLGAISITYLEAVYPLILIGIVRILVWLYESDFRCIMCIFRCLHTRIARFQRYWNIQRSLVHTFASFILLSYSRFILVSFLLLNTTPLVTDNGKSLTRVAFYDGTVPYFSAKHALFVFLSLPVLFIFAFVTPLLLIVPSLVHNLTIIRSRWPKIGRFIPDLDKYNVSCSPRLTKFINTLTNFLEAFHGCYRDSTNATERYVEFDFRWFAGFYLVLRMALFGVYAFTRDWFEQYCFLQFFCVIGFLAFLFLRPYKDDYYNKLDAGMFSLLLGINTLTMYNYGTTLIYSKPSVSAFSLQYILVFIPLIYMLAIVTRHLYRRISAKCAERKHRRHTFAADPEQAHLVAKDEGPLTQSGSHDYLSFLNETGRLEDMNTYKPANRCTEQQPISKTHSVNSNTRPSYLRDNYEKIDEQPSLSPAEGHSYLSSKEPPTHQHWKGVDRDGEKDKVT